MTGVEVPVECMPPRGVVERIRAAAAKRARKRALRLAAERIRELDRRAKR